MPINWIKLTILECLHTLEKVQFGSKEEEELRKDLMILVNKYFPHTYMDSSIYITREQTED